MEEAAGPSSCPRSLRSLRRFDGSATCPRPRQLFHHERHLSHRASSSRKLQLKPKATALSDMYPGRAGMNSAISARSLLNPKNPLAHSGVLADLNIARRGADKRTIRPYFFHRPVLLSVEETDLILKAERADKSLMVVRF